MQHWMYHHSFQLVRPPWTTSGHNSKIVHVYILPLCSAFRTFLALFQHFLIISFTIFYGTLYNIGWLHIGCIYTPDTHSGSSDTFQSLPTLLSFHFQYSDILIGLLISLSFEWPLRSTRRSFQHHSGPSEHLIYFISPLLYLNFRFTKKTERDFSSSFTTVNTLWSWPPTMLCFILLHSDSFYCFNTHYPDVHLIPLPLLFPLGSILIRHCWRRIQSFLVPFNHSAFCLGVCLCLCPYRHLSILVCFVTHFLFLCFLADGTPNTTKSWYILHAHWMSPSPTKIAYVLQALSKISAMNQVNTVHWIFFGDLVIMSSTKLLWAGYKILCKSIAAGK